MVSACCWSATERGKIRVTPSGRPWGNAVPLSTAKDGLKSSSWVPVSEPLNTPASHCYPNSRKVIAATPP